jgi:hypothetical protein
LRRIRIGLEAQVEKAPLARAYVTSVERFMRVAEVYHQQIDQLPSKKNLGRALTKDERLHVAQVKLASAQQHRALVEEAFREPVAVLSMEDLLIGQVVEPTIEGEQRLTVSTLNAVSPVVTKLFGTTNALPIDQPLDTIKAGGSTYGLAKPMPEEFLVTVNHGVSNDTNGRHAGLGAPIPTVTTKGSHGLVSPEARPVEALKRAVPEATLLPQHTYNRDTTATTDVPLPTITTISRHGLAQADIQAAKTPEPFIASYHSGVTKADRRPLPIDEPLGTQTTEPRFSLVEPVVVSHGGLKGEAEHNRTRTLDDPIVTTTTRGGYLAEPTIAAPQPILVSQHYGFDNANPALDDPVATCTTRGAGYIATPVIDSAEVLESVGIPDGFVTPNFGERDTQRPRTHSLDAPLPTATSHGAGMLVQPDASKVTGTVEPIIIPQQRGAGVEADSIERPLRTLTTKNGTCIATPHESLASMGINIKPGTPWIVVDNLVFETSVLYRMLNPDELSRAMSFSADGEEYRFTKNTSTQQKVKMIGNAVAVKTAMTLIEHAMAYRFQQAKCNCRWQRDGTGIRARRNHRRARGYAPGS